MTVIGKQGSLGYPAIGVMPPDSPMAEDDPREQIAKLELHIERLAEVAERCRKFMLTARIAILFGGTLLAALVLRVLGFDPVTMVVGITATIKPYETNVLLNDIIPQGKTGAMFQQKWGGWTFDYDNTDYSMYHSGEKWNPYDKDEKLDKLLESQRPLTDRAEREKILKEIGSYTAERALEIPLYNTNAIYGINKRVKGFVAPPDNRLKLTDVTVE